VAAEPNSSQDLKHLLRNNSDAPVTEIQMGLLKLSKPPCATCDVQRLHALPGQSSHDFAICNTCWAVVGPSLASQHPALVTLVFKDHQQIAWMRGASQKLRRHRPWRS
jgi:hypothetical protein